MSGLPSHSGLFKRIREDNGVEALQPARHYANTACKISRTYQHMRCRRYQLLPRSLEVKPLMPTAQGRRIAQRTGFQFLAARVQHCYSKLKSLETDLFFQKRQLDYALGTEKSEALEKLVADTQTRTVIQTKERQKRKFDNLVTRRAPTQPSQGNRRVVNLSSRPLQDSQVSALSKGLNFAPAPGRISTTHFTSVEAAINRSGVDDNVAAKAHMSVIGAVNRAKMPPRNIPPQELKALKELASDQDILVLPADKGRATVVMDRTDYDEKMHKMLSEESTYQPIAKDPTPSLERKMIAQLMNLKRSGRLSSNLYMQLRSSAGRVPLLYGLPKVHKQAVPLQPIVSFVTSPTYQLSKFLFSVLAPLVG